MTKWLERMLLLAVLPVALWLPAAVAAASVDIVIADNNPSMQNLAMATDHALQQIEAPPTTHILTLSQAKAVNRHGGLLIVIGDNLLDWAASADNHHASTLFFYISAGRYHALKLPQRRSALFRDQPLSRQIALARVLLPNAHSALVIHSEPLIPDAGFNPQQLRSNDFQVQIERVDAEQDWAKQLSRWMMDDDVLIGIEDKALYNRNTIRSILLTTYRHGKFVIGPNRGFVDAGCLASTYTSPEHYLQQLQVMVQNWMATGQLPPPQYPRLFDIAVNRQVARSLGLNLADDATLMKALRQNLREEER